MEIKHPTKEQIPTLRQLWIEAFDDTDSFLDKFFSTAFSPERAMCATDGCEVIAAAYWFDCGDYAYIYAVATAKKHQGRGICHALMEKIHGVLTLRGYAGCILVPGEENLRQFYRGMGYENCGGVTEFDADATAPLPLRKLSATEYAALRRQYLPEGGVVQDGVNLDFLACWAEFYAAPNALAAVTWEDGKLMVLDLLGDVQTAGGIVATLGAETGWFRCPGEEPFAMHRPLGSNTPPKYFAFCF